MYDIRSVNVSLINSRIEKQCLKKRRGREISLCQERYRYSPRDVEVFIAIAWAGTPIEPTCSPAYVSQTSWLLDFFDYLSVFFICRRVGPMGLIAKRKRRRERERETEMRCSARGRNASFVHFVVLENRILIAWMPLKILVDRNCAKESERCTVIDPNMQTSRCILANT